MLKQISEHIKSLKGWPWHLGANPSPANSLLHYSLLSPLLPLPLSPSSSSLSPLSTLSPPVPPLHFFKDRILWCSPGWIGIHYITVQAGCKLIARVLLWPPVFWDSMCLSLCLISTLPWVALVIVFHDSNRTVANNTCPVKSRGKSLLQSSEMGPRCSWSKSLGFHPVYQELPIKQKSCCQCPNLGSHLCLLWELRRVFISNIALKVCLWSA